MLRNAVVAFALVDPCDVERVSGLRWHLSGSGYAMRSAGGRAFRRGSYMHRVILGLDPDDPLECDHINGIKLDNRRANLRACTHAQNLQNVPGKRGKTSRFRGVHFDNGTGRWAARASIEGKTYYLGRHDTEDEAATAIIAFRRDHMPYSIEAFHEQ
jgi:hypothetical protein